MDQKETLSKVILYIACSLDGFIADDEGKVDWLPQPKSEHDFGYGKFLKDIGITLFGSKTYEQVLSFGDWPYGNLDNYVFSQREIKRIPGVKIINEDAASFVEDLKDTEFNNIWLVGGSQLIKSLLNADLIDEFIITECPILLGSGIPLFQNLVQKKQLRLIHSKSFEEGVVQNHYQLIN